MPVLQNLRQIKRQLLFMRGGIEGIDRATKQRHAFATVHGGKGGIEQKELAVVSADQSNSPLRIEKKAVAIEKA